jgi:hypothetical protein
MRGISARWGRTNRNTKITKTRRFHEEDFWFEFFVALRVLRVFVLQFNDYRTITNLADTTNGGGAIGTINQQDQKFCKGSVRWLSDRRRALPNEGRTDVRKEYPMTGICLVGEWMERACLAGVVPATEASPAASLRHRDGPGIELGLRLAATDGWRIGTAPAVAPAASMEAERFDEEPERWDGLS